MHKPPILILGIESSCDDTGSSIVYNGKVLSNIIANQSVHEAFGGVVPELASRAHQQNIVPVVSESLKKAGIDKKELSAVAFTRGPGLLGSLLVGSSFAKSFALALEIPLIEVNHMQAHVLAHFIEEDGQKKPEFPFLCLTVSGGHTQILKVSDYFKMEILGETSDDAAGEAFDKVAKILGLPYPGGPLIDKYGATGNPFKYNFPKANVPELNFSFSGLKTAFMYFIRDEIKKEPDFIQNNLADICASIQRVIVDTLMSKMEKAVETTRIKTVCLAGGVSANSALRKAILRKQESSEWKVFIPKFEYCTDNAAMIAIAGYYKYLNKDFADQSITPMPRYLF